MKFKGWYYSKIEIDAHLKKIQSLLTSSTKTLMACMNVIHLIVLVYQSILSKHKFCEDGCHVVGKHETLYCQWVINNKVF